MLKGIIRDTAGFQTIQQMPLPLDPKVVVTGMLAEKAYMFKSALVPLKLTFTTVAGPEYSIIYKLGDDLRQDQLILQLFMLMDRLLKNENLDLQLTPYSALATSGDIGMLQCVPKCEALAAIFKDFGNIKAFLKKHNADDSTPHGIKKDVGAALLNLCYIVYSTAKKKGAAHAFSDAA